MTKVGSGFRFRIQSRDFTNINVVVVKRIFQYIVGILDLNCLYRSNSSIVPFNVMLGITIYFAGKAISVINHRQQL